MKVTINGFVHHSRGYSGADQYRIHSCDMTDCGYTMVGPIEVEYEVPANFNPVAAEVAALNKQLDTLADEYHREAKRIKGRINDLLCLEAPDENAEAADFLGAK